MLNKRSDWVQRTSVDNVFNFTVEISRDVSRIGNRLLFKAHCLDTV